MFYCQINPIHYINLFRRIPWNNRTHPIFPEFSKTIEHLLFFQNSQALSFENPWRAMNITICSISGELLAFSHMCGGERERSLASNNKVWFGHGKFWISFKYYSFLNIHILHGKNGPLYMPQILVRQKKKCLIPNTWPKKIG